MNENLEKDNLRTQLVNELLKDPDKKLYNLSNDLLFKKVFSNPDNCKILLKRFFNIESKNIKTLNSNLYINQKNMYAGVADLIFEVDKNTLVLLEMQNVNKYNFDKRLTDYSAGIIYINGLKKNDDFKDLKDFKCFAIVNYDISEKDLKDINLKTKDNIIVGNNLNAKIINLKRDKFDDLTDELFKVKKNEELSKICEVIDEEMLNIISLIVKYNREDEEKMKEIEELMLNEKLDLKAAEEYGRKSGISIGERRGQNLEKENIARNMLRENYEIPTISKLTNLSEQKILSLR